MNIFKLDNCKFNHFGQNAMSQLEFGTKFCSLR